MRFKKKKTTMSGKLNSKIPKIRQISGWTILFIFLFLGSSVGIYGKYYSVKSNKGVTTASGLYFTSNLIKEIKESGEYQDIYNNNSWNGSGTYQFNLQVRNYENQLLYNDENLTISYDITFELLGSEDGYQYKVSKNDESAKSLNTKSSIVYKDVLLGGGQMLANHFTVSVVAPDNASSRFTSRGIKVTAVPVSPDYMANAKKLGGILYATTVVGTYQMSYQFEAEASLSDEEQWTDQDKALLDSYSALPWTLATTGETTSQARKVRIEWENTYLQINKFDEYYSEKAIEKGSNYMIIEVGSYESIPIIFYRMPALQWNVIQSKEQLHRLIKVTEVTE